MYDNSKKDDQINSQAGNSDNVAGLEKDKSLRIGSTHGDATATDEKTGYARDIGQDSETGTTSREARTKGSGLTGYAKKHPSRNLKARRQGFGIGGGYERPYRKERMNQADSEKELYGPLPHSGYYGTGIGARPFKRGQAGYSDELSWYESQYGVKTTDYKKQK
jgi:hypothetical protein